MFIYVYFICIFHYLYVAIKDEKEKILKYLILIYLPDPGIKAMSPASAALAGGFFTTSTTQEAYIYIHTYVCMYIHVYIKMSNIFFSKE